MEVHLDGAAGEVHQLRRAAEETNGRQDRCDPTPRGEAIRGQDEHPEHSGHHQGDGHRLSAQDGEHGNRREMSRQDTSDPPMTLAPDLLRQWSAYRQEGAEAVEATERLHIGEAPGGVYGAGCHQQLQNRRRNVEPAKGLTLPCFWAEREAGGPTDEPDHDGAEVDRSAGRKYPALGTSQHQGGPTRLAGGEEDEEGSVQGVLTEVFWTDRGVNARGESRADRQPFDEERSLPGPCEP